MWKIDNERKKIFYLFHIFIHKRDKAGKRQTFIEWGFCFMVEHCLSLPQPLQATLSTHTTLNKSFMILSWYFIVLHGMKRKKLFLFFFSISAVINKMFSSQGREEKKISSINELFSIILVSSARLRVERGRRRITVTTWWGNSYQLQTSFSKINRKKGSFVISACGGWWQSF